jgi:hypothetical protein
VILTVAAMKRSDMAEQNHHQIIPQFPTAKPIFITNHETHEEHEGFV